MFLNFFSKTEAGHVLKMFLQFWLISASRSYKLGSYRKKSNRRFKIFSYPEETSFSIFRANHFVKVEQKSGLNEPTNETYRCETSVCHGCPPKI